MTTVGDLYPANSRPCFFFCRRGQVRHVTLSRGRVTQDVPTKYPWCVRGKRVSCLTHQSRSRAIKPCLLLRTSWRVLRVTMTRKGKVPQKSGPSRGPLPPIGSCMLFALLSYLATSYGFSRHLSVIFMGLIYGTSLFTFIVTAMLC